MMKTTTKLILALALFLALFNGCSEDELFFDEEKTQELNTQRLKTAESITGGIPEPSNATPLSSVRTPIEICNCINLIIEYKVGTTEIKKKIFRNNWAECVGLIKHTRIDDQKEYWLVDNVIYHDHSTPCPEPIQTTGEKKDSMDDDSDVNGIESEEIYYSSDY